MTKAKPPPKEFAKASRQTLTEMPSDKAAETLMAHPIVQETRWLLEGVRKASPDAFLVLEPDPMCRPLTPGEAEELQAWIKASEDDGPSGMR